MRIDGQNYFRAWIIDFILDKLSISLRWAIMAQRRLMDVVFALVVPTIARILIIKLIIVWLTSKTCKVLPILKHDLLLNRDFMAGLFSWYPVYSKSCFSASLGLVFQLVLRLLPHNWAKAHCIAIYIFMK